MASEVVGSRGVARWTIAAGVGMCWTPCCTGLCSDTLELDVCLVGQHVEYYRSSTLDAVTLCCAITQRLFVTMHETVSCLGLAAAEGHDVHGHALNSKVILAACHNTVTRTHHSTEQSLRVKIER